MPALHETNNHNVRTSINQWLVDKAATFSLPLSTTFTWEFLFKGTAITPPCVSVFHAPISRSQAWLGSNAGGVTGVEASNLADLSIWLNRDNTWTARMDILLAMFSEIFAVSNSVPIKDYRTSQAAPTATPYIARITQFEQGSVDPDTENAGIMRSRNTLRYEWALRTSAS